MGMLRLFLPGQVKSHQFTPGPQLTGAGHLSESRLHSSPSQMSLASRKSLRGVMRSFIRPREFFAEFLGTFIMIAIQKSAAISLSTLVTREDRAGDAAMLTGGLSAGLGVMVAILVTGGNSGAHMNPAVSLGMAIWGRIPVSALPAYIMGQFLGAGAAAGLLVAVWWDVMKEVGPEVMSTAPVLGVGEASLGVDQGLATFLMVLVACSLDHQGHSPAGLLMGLTVGTVTITMGQNAGASMNPAADVMPRLIAAIYRGAWSPFSVGGRFWLIPFLVPYLGSVIAVSVYSLFIEKLEVINTSDSRVPKLDGRY